MAFSSYYFLKNWITPVFYIVSLCSRFFVLKFYIKCEARNSVMGSNRERIKNEQPLIVLSFFKKLTRIKCNHYNFIGWQIHLFILCKTYFWLLLDPSTFLKLFHIAAEHSCSVFKLLHLLVLASICNTYII